MTAFENPAAAEVFSGYPVAMRKKLMFLRQIIFDVTAHMTVRTSAQRSTEAIT